VIPASAQILDPLLAPGGAMTSGNWIQDVGGDDPMNLVAGQGAAATNPSSEAVAIWGVRVNVFLSAFVTVATLPASGLSAGVGGSPDKNLGNPLEVLVTPINGLVSMICPNGTPSANPGTLHNGDAIGITYVPQTDTATAWYRAVGAVGWTNLFSTTAGFGLGVPSNWYLFIGGSDQAMRLRDFGGTLLAGTNPTINQPSLIHGRGAC
jgi:hypothetical protein